MKATDDNDGKADCLPESAETPCSHACEFVRKIEHLDEYRPNLWHIIHVYRCIHCNLTFRAPAYDELVTPEGIQVIPPHIEGV